tara:strand:- start:6553 stop:6891 length:339 start_codon:yes stop_codon:yes gene_type:complete
MAADIDETIERPVATAHDQYRHPSERTHDMIARRCHSGVGTRDLPAGFEDRRLLDAEPVIAAIKVRRQGRGPRELMGSQALVFGILGDSVSYCRMLGLAAGGGQRFDGMLCR